MNEAARSLIDDIDDIFKGVEDWEACALTAPDSEDAENLVEFRLSTEQQLDDQVQARLAAAFRVHMPTPFMLKVHFCTLQAAQPYAIGSTSKTTS